ncbi:MAG: FKBP-type peptidyl-prolyl cis-trans isomerase [Bacteroidales bacterium]|nr:FKBP-type peptidyl-prolyl cis-trans isomerase [Bacteroidales bacterium]
MTNRLFRTLPGVAAMSLLLAPVLTSCLGDDSLDYTEWKKRNDQFVTDAKNATIDGEPEYQVISPVFAPGSSILMKWHNDRSKTANNLKPLDNSTVDCIYICRDIDGNYIDSSYASTTYGDSIYRSRPTKNIVGFWTALTNMHVGDSVTVIIPSDAGYGSSQYNSIKPYTTIVYGIKLKGIPAYELPE